MSRSTRIFISLGVVVTALSVFIPWIQAKAEYPEKPLTIIEPWAPGSVGDVPMRILGELAKKDFGQPIVVQNLVGGGGARAMLQLKKSDPDGYTIANSWVANQVMSPIFNPDVGYTRHDFEPIILAIINPFTLVVKSNHPAKNLKDFVQWAKGQPRKLNVSICAATGLPRLVMQRFLEVAKIENYTPVPFQDCETENIKGLFDGSVDFATGALAVEKIYGDQVRTLAIFTEERSPIAKHIPTAKEQGYDLEWGPVSAGWSGLVAPLGTPKDRLQKLINILGRWAQSPEFLKRCTDAGITVMYLPTDAFHKLWDDSHNRLKPRIEELLKKK